MMHGCEEVPSMRSLVFVIIYSVYSNFCIAAPAVTSDDGREIILNDDGSWSYASTDRFATTIDGRRVRLMQDGSWSYTGEKSLAGQKVAVDQKYIEGQSLELKLDDLVIETTRGKKSQSHKSARKKTHSVFYINVTVDKTAAKAVKIALGNDDFTVEDTDGRKYPILSVKPAKLSIKPGEYSSIIVHADGSPHWWTTEAMTVTANKKIFDSVRDITLSKALSEAKRKEVEGFE
jgi:hypothetical protein